MSSGLPPKRTVTILLTVYSLSQHGSYVKDLVTFEGELDDMAEGVPLNLSLPLCLVETPDGIQLSSNPPELPEEPVSELRQLAAPTNFGMELSASPDSPPVKS